MNQDINPNLLDQSDITNASGESFVSKDKEEESEDKAYSGYEMDLSNMKVKTKPEYMEQNIILSVNHLKQFFPMGSVMNRSWLKAVHDVSFQIKEGECMGLVGESGCGKTTTGRTLMRLYPATSGSVYYKGVRIQAGSRWNKKEIKWKRIKARNKIKELSEKLRKDIEAAGSDQDTINQLQNEYNREVDNINSEVEKIVATQKAKIKQIDYDNSHVDKKLLSEIQMIFQDPIDSLDPRMTVEEIIQEGLEIQGFHNHNENHQKVVDALNEVGLIEDYCSRYPHEFSGGQRQRVGIARALVMNPKLLICDEPISALDVSIRAQVINLLNNLKVKRNLSILFIAHDLSVVKYFCDKIAVMYFGDMVELASSDELFHHPLHPYTKSLLSAIPKPNPISERRRERIKYDPKVSHDYSVEKPKFVEIVPGHFVLANSEEVKKYKEEIQAIDAQKEE